MKLFGHNCNYFKLTYVKNEQVKMKLCEITYKNCVWKMNMWKKLHVKLKPVGFFLQNRQNMWKK